MSRRPYLKATKRDDAEAPIVEALEAAGFVVYKLDSPCDLMVGTWGAGWVLMEVKTPGPNQKRVQESQRELEEESSRRCLPFCFVRTPKDAMARMKAWTS